MNEFKKIRDSGTSKFSRQWECLVARMRDAAKYKLGAFRQGGKFDKQSGLAILSVTCLIDEKGEVLVWTEPKVQRIEPSRDAKRVIMGVIKWAEENES